VKIKKKKVTVQIAATVPMEDIIQECIQSQKALTSIADIFEVNASSENDFIEAAGDADAVITTWGMRISRKIIERLDNCVIISVGSVGVDMVDVDAATEAGIIVTNVPDIYIEEVADHTLMLILAAARRVKEMAGFVLNNGWYKGRPVLSGTPRLWGQTLGLVGFGNVAMAVARRAKPFGFRILSFDPYVSELKMTGEGIEPVSFEELLRRSDYISLHPLLNEETHHMISAEAFGRMKKTASIVNTARGPLIDETALVNALQKGEIAGAALDVLETEPPDPENPLIHMPNVIITPHVASATSRMRPEAMRRVGEEVALTLSGRWPRSCVNPMVLPRCKLERWQPYPMNRGPNR
jgi:D-3-phosphoglycerate dehydrogenase / 2-oxoglutarate reductase